MWNIKRRSFAVAMLALSIIMLWTHENRALGQLTPVGLPTIELFGGQAVVSQPAGGEFTLSAVGGAYSLKGDAHFQLPRDPSVPQFSAFVFGVQRVTVGPLPVQITPTASASFKLVNGGGPASTTFPTTTVNTFIGVLEASSGGRFPALQLSGANHELVGNGYAIINETYPPVPGYVLAAGLTYDLGLQYSLLFDLTGASAAYPTVVVTLEAGGISGWPGFSVDFNPLVVPEPAVGLAALVLAVGMIGRRGTRQRA